MMPGTGGIELCRRIRPLVDSPILFLTAKSDEESIVKGLMTGADDYITKPFGVQELMARVNAHVRRERREKHQTKRLISGFMFDFDNKEVWIGDRKLPLTKNEYKIVECLAQHKTEHSHGSRFTRKCTAWTAMRSIQPLRSLSEPSGKM